MDMKNVRQVAYLAFEIGRLMDNPGTSAHDRCESLLQKLRDLGVDPACMHQEFTAAFARGESLGRRMD